MSRKKILWMIWTAAVVWAVAVIQILTTRFFVSRMDMTQAFARNQLVIEDAKGQDDPEVQKDSEDTRNTKAGNKCIQAFKPGRLSTEEMSETAKALFGTMGGSVVMDHAESSDSGYYVAYGYTSGIAGCKKVNGHRVNMNVAIQYDETKGRTCVTMGTPLINSDI